MLVIHHQCAMIPENKQWYRLQLRKSVWGGITRRCVRSWRLWTSGGLSSSQTGPCWCGPPLLTFPILNVSGCVMNTNFVLFELTCKPRSHMRFYISSRSNKSPIFVLFFKNIIRLMFNCCVFIIIAIKLF